MIKHFFILGCLLLSSCAPDVGGGQNEKGFLPEKLCKETAGVWERVDPSVYPTDTSLGIFSNHPDYNVRCVCPEKTSWTSSGCQ